MNLNLKELPKDYVKIVDDPSGNGDQLIEFSDEFMEKNGWLVGDTIDVDLDEKGSVIIKNKSSEERQKKTSSKNQSKKKS